MIHALKTLPEYFDAVLSGRKTFEIRRNDRDYNEGDYLALNEWDGEVYTGRSCMVQIDYILYNSDFLEPGYVALSIKPCVVGSRAKSPFGLNREKLYGVPLLETIEEDAK